MNKKESPDKKIIKQIINELNTLWLSKNYEAIGAHLSNDVIIAPPGSDDRIIGRKAYVQSYRDYDQSAVTHKFSPGEPKIDIANRIAIAICPFHVVYEMKGTKYEETGQEILVFSRRAGVWKVVWRTTHVEPVK